MCLEGCWWGGLVLVKVCIGDGLVIVVRIVFGDGVFRYFYMDRVMWIFGIVIKLCVNMMIDEM